MMLLVFFFFFFGCIQDMDKFSGKQTKKESNRNVQAQQGYAKIIPLTKSSIKSSVVGSAKSLKSANIRKSKLMVV